jgi:hypothetical protein
MNNELGQKAKWYHRFVAGIFLLLLLLPLLQMIFHFCNEPENVEKRKPALPPQLREKSIDGFHGYAHSFELWFNDHFGLRKLLVRTNALINYNILHTSPKTMVVVGKQGWLYYDKQDDGKNLVDFYGKANFTSKQIQDISTKLDTFKNRMNRMQIPVLFVFIPNKHTIYPEYLPFNLPKERAARTRANQVDSIFAKKQIPYINLRKTLEKAKQTYSYPIYYRTDSHWNKLGSHVGYMAIMNEISKNIPRLIIHPLTDYQVSAKEEISNHDLANLIYLGGVLRDFEIDLKPKFEEKMVYTNEKCKLPAKVFVNKDTTLPKLLMFHDSYALSLRPFMAESFSRSAFVWNSPSYPEIEKEKPDILVIEFVERFSEMLLKL